MPGWVVILGVVIITITVVAIVLALHFKKRRQSKDLERSLKMVPLLIHLPPSTDDIQGGGRDERDVNNEAISSATVMYSIISSTFKKSGIKNKIYGQKHFSFDIVAVDGLIKYYAVVPAVLEETVKQAVVSSYPTARLEEADIESIFPKGSTAETVAGGEFKLKKEFIYPLATYEDMRWDAQTALLNAFAKVKEKEGLALQLMFRPANPDWTKKSVNKIASLRGEKAKGWNGSNAPSRALDLFLDVAKSPFEVPDEHKYDDNKAKEEVTPAKQEEAQTIEGKMKYPGFECLLRVVACSASKQRSEALVGGIVAAMAQFDSAQANGFKYDMLKNSDQLATDYIFHFFPRRQDGLILNTMELASIFHLPSQNSIPSSGVERQLTKQVDGPSMATLSTEGVMLGVNKYRGEEKKIRLSEKDRRRHTYIIGATGMGKSVLLKNIAYQDMMDGRGFAFIDPHGDVAEELLSMVPPERIDDVIYFDPGNIDFPIGMNMLEFNTEEQKDFIVQEGINMLYSLYDPGHTGIFGPRGEQMFRNAALLLMSDPRGATFIDIPKPFTDPELVKDKLQYVTDKNVYDYWTKEFPASQKSNDAGEVTTWFNSKWGPFLSNTMLRNVLGQTKSGFNIREIMDQKKILLVNLSKGKVGELNSRLLGMIFVMKFQAAAMSRVDTPENERNDFCLFVDEFQNFSTDSFESILSEARKFRLNLVVANQFMTQLTDKIREGVLGNVGTIIAGRVGVTDAEMLEKVFSPTFNAEDLHKQPNFHAITTVMMHDMPTSPFTMSLLPPIGKENPEVLESMKQYSSTRYGRPKKEVEKEIYDRLAVKKPAAPEREEVMPGGGAPAGVPAAPAPAAPAPQAAGNFSAPTKVSARPRADWLNRVKTPAAAQPAPESMQKAEAEFAKFATGAKIAPESAKKPEVPVRAEVFETPKATPEEKKPEVPAKRTTDTMSDGDIIRLR